MTNLELRLLLIDDSVEDRTYLKRLLVRGYKGTTLKFVEAETLKKAVALASDGHFDCAIVDQRLPDGNGLEFLHAVAVLCEGHGFPIVFMTGLGDEHLAANAIKAGALEYVSKKQLTEEVIFMAVRNAMARFLLVEHVRITKEKAAALAEESLRQYRFLAESVPQIVYTCRADGSRDFQNTRATVYSGITMEKLKESRWETVIQAEDRTLYLNAWRRALATGEAFETEYRIRRNSDKMYRWHLSRALPFRDEAGVVLRWVGTCTDIHEKKTEQERLEAQVRTRTEQLRTALMQKEVLLQEVHHRVKNNLEVISSLIGMQAGMLKGNADAGQATALEECQQRVLSIGLIYDRLSRNYASQDVDFSEYAGALLEGLIQTCNRKAGKVEGELNAAAITLGIDQAIPCGLILNELVSNAIKYAYPNEASGKVRVAITQTVPGRMQLCVSDDGVGLPQGWNINDAHSLGLPIVNGLAKQLGGTLTIMGGVGASFLVNFPIEKPWVKAASTN